MQRTPFSLTSFDFYITFVSTDHFFLLENLLLISMTPPPSHFPSPSLRIPPHPHLQMLSFLRVFGSHPFSICFGNFFHVHGSTFYLHAGNPSVSISTPGCPPKCQLLPSRSLPLGCHSGSSNSTHPKLHLPFP